MLQPSLQYHQLSQPAAKLAYRYRPGAKSPILVLHGIGGSSLEEYAPLFTDEALRGWPILAVDLLGFGYSDKPEDFSYQLAAQTEAIFSLSQALHLEPMIILGHSLGGSLALLFYQRYPNYTRAILMAEGGLESKYLTLSRWASRYSEEVFAEQFEILSSGAGGMLGGFSAQPTLQMTSARAFYRSSCSLMQLAKDGALLEGFYRAEIPKEYWIGERSLSRWGDAFCLELSARQIRWRIIPGAGHQLMLDQPACCALALADFVNQLETTT